MDDCNCCVVLVPGGGRNSRLNATESFCVVTAAHNVCVGRGGGAEPRGGGGAVTGTCPAGRQGKGKKEQSNTIDPRLVLRAPVGW
jgi:hypothetical protein